MTAIQMPRKELNVDDKVTYSYVHIEAKTSLPTFLLLHGFPSSAYDWRHQIAHLRQAGYGIIAPDLLGYGRTDSPEAIEDYKFSKMSVHISKILEHHKIRQVIGVAHDWGSVLLSRLWNNYPQYFLSLVFLAVPYTPPGPFDLDAVNAMTEEFFGYPIYGYWKFFNEPDAADVLARHHESFVSIMYSDDPELWKSDFCPVGSLRNWVTAGKMAPLPTWLTAQERDEQSKIVLEKDYTGPLNWYKAVIRGMNADDDRRIARERVVVNVPVFLVAGALDAICRPEVVSQAADQGQKEAYLPIFEMKVVPEAGHWLQLEKPDEILETLEQAVKISL